LIQLRKDHPIIVWGDYELVKDTPEQVFMYLRHFEGETWAIVANFGEQTNTLQLEHLGQSSDVVISNYERTSVNFHHIELKPYEAFAVKL
jgi:glucan 1,6-alpha-glucosidase